MPKRRAEPSKDRPSQRDRRGVAAPLVGTWSIVGNGHVGVLEIGWSAEQPTGRIRYDAIRKWEALTDLTFDGRTLVFTRPGPAQIYTGEVADGALRGTFTESGEGHYSWSASRRDPRERRAAKPTARAPQGDPLGAWTVLGNGFGGTLELASSGGSLTGRIRYDSIGTWEVLTGVSYERRKLVFTRPGPGQVYSGACVDDCLFGAFTQHGEGKYLWVASRPDWGVEPRGEVADAATRPARDGEHAAVGEWSLVGNGHVGELQIARFGGRLNGRVRYDAIGVWEPLTCVSHDRGKLVFTRPAAAQIYTGVLADASWSGTFTHDGVGRYVWTASRKPSSIPRPTQ